MLSQHKSHLCLQRAPTRFPRTLGPTLWLGAALGFLPAGILLQAQQAAPGAEKALPVLAAGEMRALTIEPGQPQDLAVTVPAGRMEVLTLEQKSGMSGMIAAQRGAADAGGQSLAYTSDGGQASQERVALFGADRDIVYTVTFKTREKHRASEAEISLSAQLVPDEIDRKLADAEAAYARAETIRRGTAKGEPADSAALYDAAIAKASELQGSASPVSDAGSLERRAWTGKARLLMYREEDYLGGEQAAKHAVDPARNSESLPLAEKADLALAWKTYASALALLNRYDEAVDATQHALALYEQTGDEYWQGIVVGNLAFVYRETGQTAKAMEAAELSLKLAERQKDDYGRAFALSAKGAISQGSGDYQAALDSYYRSLDVIEILKKTMPHPTVEGEVWSNIGEIYASLGDWEQAEDAYRHALPVLQAASDGVNEIEAAGRLAEAEMHAGKLDLAKRDYQAAVTRADEKGLERQKTHLLTGLARAEMGLGAMAARPDNHFAAAKALFEHAETAALAIHQIDGQAEALGGLGDLLSKSGKSREARASYARAAELWEQIPNELEAARARANLARLDRQNGQLDRAREEIFAVLDQVERARSTLVSESLRTSYFSSRHSFYELAIDVLMDLDARAPGNNYAVQAWAVAERARARTLLDELSAGEKTSAMDEKQEALELQIREAEDRLAHLGTTREDAAKAEEAVRALRGLLLDADRAGQQARSHRLESASGAGLGSAHTEASIAETSGVEPTELNAKVRQDEALVAKALGGDTALYEFWTGMERSYLWVILPAAGGDSVKAYSLPAAADLETLAGQFMGALREREREDPNKTAAELDRIWAAADLRTSRLGKQLGQLLLPMASAGEARDSLRRLVIVPDGPLEKLPFAALQVPRSIRGSGGSGSDSGEPADAARKSSYLVQRCELVEEPSAASLIQLAMAGEREGRRHSEAVAVFADPVYSKTDPRLNPTLSFATLATTVPVVLRQAGVGIVLPQLPRLPGSKREALEIRQIAGPRDTSLFLDFDANPSTLTETDWSHYRVLHIAAHAIANDEEPELSGIALSMVKRDGMPVNGVVRLHDVYRMHTPVELVVLSACSSFGGRNVTGEGVEGLARAFLVAGSRSVLAMQWGADDSSTSELMRTFYNSFLRGGEPSPAALRDAQIQMIETPHHAAPYYWAGAMLEGSWRGQ